MDLRQLLEAQLGNLVVSLCERTAELNAAMAKIAELQKALDDLKKGD